MSVDKKICKINGAVLVEVKTDLNKVFTEYFTEVVKEVCYQHLAKGMFEELHPEVVEQNAYHDLLKCAEAALKKVVRNTFVDIVASGEDAAFEEIKERLGANA